MCNKTKTFASISGGADSTAMVVRWLEMGEPLDFMLFCDTGMEFGAMQEYIKKLDGYLQRRFNKKIHYITPPKSYYELAFEDKITRGERAGRYRGLPPALKMSYCTRDLKIRPSASFMREHCEKKQIPTLLIGYTAGEVARGRAMNIDYASVRYPLAEWGWNEGEVGEYLKKLSIANPLYERFSRTGCFCCPKQSLKSLYQLFKHYPKEWELMKQWEAKAVELNAVNQRWHIRYTMGELEAKFKRQGDELLSVSFDEGEVCFCNS